MKILITGATGLIGTALKSYLTGQSHSTYMIVRRPAQSTKEIQWDPGAKQIDRAKIDGMDAAVHLSGENIAAGRWTPERKKAILESRVNGTRFLSEELASTPNPPKTLICASASGYYGDRGTEVLTEESGPGNEFLSDVCKQWEAAADPAREKGIRVAHTRFGIVLSPKGGALAKMLTPFKFGAGGPIGSGQQYWSWIALDDVVAAIDHAIHTESLQDGINTVTPNPVTNSEFTKALGCALMRPAFFPLPSFVAHLALGEMADELLLASCRMHPAKLIATNYVFRYPDLTGALYHLLK